MARFGRCRCDVAVCAIWLLAAAGAQQPAGGHRLATESSPYLREHAGDPVDWFPWGDQAFAKAKADGKPVFISIGYSACHWCHVMQRESFQNAEIAALLNEGFVSIKIDREERPDVDRVYMEACQRLSQGGCGWPLTIFASPERAPFHVGTYYPPDDRGERRGFRNLVKEALTLWKNDRGSLEERARNAKSFLAGAQRRDPSTALPERSLIDDGVRGLRSHADSEHGGFGRAPKFPSPPAAQLLLWNAARRGVPREANEVRGLLDALLRGGIRDHAGGGFHRYSTDAAWKVPHFEKMLYDQALLARLFGEAGACFGETRYERAAHELLEFCRRELQTEDGAFIAALDADTNGVEGLSYTWTLDELRKHLPGDLFDIVAAWCEATEAGNFEEGRNILYEAVPPVEIARTTGASEATILRKKAEALALLARARANRPAPHRDTKVLAGWNALMISALANPRVRTPDPAHVADAIRLARFIERCLLREDGRAWRSFADGQARHPGELSDHAAILNAWLDLHEATLEDVWLEKAKRMAAVIEKNFFVDAERFVDSTEPDLLFPTNDIFDGAWPSGISLAIMGFTRLGIMTGDEHAFDIARLGTRAVGLLLAVNPSASPHLLQALDLLTAPAPRVALRGSRADPFVRDATATLRATYQPFVTRTFEPAIDTAPSAIICVGEHCLAPVTDLEGLRAGLKAALHEAEKPPGPPR